MGSRRTRRDTGVRHDGRNGGEDRPGRECSRRAGGGAGGAADDHRRRKNAHFGPRHRVGARASSSPRGAGEGERGSMMKAIDAQVIQAITRNLKDFGYGDLTEETVLAEVEKLLRHEKVG